MPRKLCEKCHERPATVPDRERMGRPTNRLCAECHRERLADDLRGILGRRMMREAAEDRDDATGVDEEAR